MTVTFHPTDGLMDWGTHTCLHLAGTAMRYMPHSIGTAGIRGAHSVACGENWPSSAMRILKIASDSIGEPRTTGCQGGRSAQAPRTGSQDGSQDGRSGRATVNSVQASESNIPARE